MTVHRAVCADCGWSFEDEDFIEVSDQLERHSQKEHHHVDLERAVATDGGVDVALDDADEWCDWCNLEFEGEPTWAADNDRITAYFCSEDCAEAWCGPATEPKRIDEFAVEQTALDGGRPQGQLTLGGGVSKEGSRDV